MARDTTALWSIVRDLEGKGVGVRVLNLGGDTVDTKSATSKLMLTILAGVATWEREIMLERQREGIAKAKAAGKYKGRKPTARANRRTCYGSTARVRRPPRSRGRWA